MIVALVRVIAKRCVLTIIWMKRMTNVIKPTNFETIVRALAEPVVLLTLRAGESVKCFRVSAFTVVALDPPRIAFCVDRPKQSLKGFHVGAAVGVSILAKHQEFLSSIPKEELALEGIVPGPRGSALLRSAYASMEVKLLQQYFEGSNLIAIGEILWSGSRKNTAPLVAGAWSPTRVHLEKLKSQIC